MMNEPENLELAVRNLKNTCGIIDSIYKDTYTNLIILDSKEWTHETLKKDAETAFRLAKEIAALPIEYVPIEIIKQTNEDMKEIETILGEVFQSLRTFPEQPGQSSRKQQEIARRLGDLVRSAMSSIGTWIPALAYYAGKIDGWTSGMEDVRARANDFLKNTEKYAKDQRAEIAKIAKDARAAAGEAGAAEFTHEFRDEAENLERKARKWLQLAGGLTVVTLALSGLIVLGLLGDIPENAWEAAYRLGGRVILISVLFYAAVWSGRLALANLHLASVNRHRAMSLQSLKAFLHATEDAGTRDSVVLEAARAAYESVPSGYIGRQAAGQVGPARMVEIIKGAARTSQGREGSGG